MCVDVSGSGVPEGVEVGSGDAGRGMTFAVTGVWTTRGSCGETLTLEVEGGSMYVNSLL